MDGIFAVLGRFLESIAAWVPRWQVLDTTAGAVKFEGFFLPAWARRYKLPMRITVLGAGLHWYWPATTEFQAYPTARQADNLPTQTVVTSDDKTIAVGGMLVYTVDDLGKLLTTTHSAVRLVQDIALTSIHDVCCNLSWDALKAEQRKGTLDTKLKNACQKQLTDYGITVIKCMLTDLAVTRVLKVIQSVNKDDE